MLKKLKLIAHKLPHRSFFYDQCGCGYKKIKTPVWLSLAVLGLFLYFL